ncbi:hypothetical protein ALO_09734 [Acetonema longum DSM 6540]|uniref:Uncharacterized protein n=1 Tax=Acetonema longum DSM 6540 TaxID=1009370 RepID=F7NIP4_9FIRM|nr:hypothetical protein ALO_09734 [Acetonema longum DSM 6540]
MVGVITVCTGFKANSIADIVIQTYYTSLAHAASIKTSYLDDSFIRVRGDRH